MTQTQRKTARQPLTPLPSSSSLWPAKQPVNITPPKCERHRTTTCARAGGQRVVWRLNQRPKRNAKQRASPSPRCCLRPRPGQPNSQPTAHNPKCERHRTTTRVRAGGRAARRAASRENQSRRAASKENQSKNARVGELCTYRHKVHSSITAHDAPNFFQVLVHVPHNIGAHPSQFTVGVHTSAM